MTVQTASDFERLLREVSGLEASLDTTVLSEVDHVIRAAGVVPSSPLKPIAQRFFGRVNEKLDANRDVRRVLYGTAARAGITFNYPQKKMISRAIDESNLDALDSALAACNVTEALRLDLVENCNPVTWETTRALLHAETIKPSKLRKAIQRTVQDDVFAAAAGSLVWALWPIEVLYKTFGGSGAGTSARDYMSYLEGLRPELFNRDRTLSIRFAKPSQSRNEQREWLAAWLASEYNALANHGFIALVVDVSSPAEAWALVNDATLFAERFREVELKQMFFRSVEVRRETMEHVDGLDPEKARFELLNEGFTYRDVFVLTDDAGAIIRLILVMQKNARDETNIPCPACRSTRIEGNSYPTLGVRSWECRNPLCPNRSIYNRGNRFQFRSIVQQAAIEDPRNTIDADNVNRWRKDVLTFVDDAEIASTLILHYSIADDGVALLDFPDNEIVQATSRKVSFEHPEPTPVGDFWSSSFFHRFLVKAPIRHAVNIRPSLDETELYEVIEGDSTSVLRTLPDDTFDRAITSPPYFNAREYAQWPNLYCYLHDMYLNSLEVFRTLKRGAIYAYNIFDYFDNERIITFSAMGRKRIPLGAIMTHVFEEVGFQLLGVIPWDKGDIHGKRGFNGGNYSPYYQSPFNCWEHVLILRKPYDESTETCPPLPAHVLRSTARIAPVFKIVQGENRYGHTAPFPEGLPGLLLEGLTDGAVVLDPYAGSGTTARAAIRRGLRAVLIERDAEYAALARRMTNEYIVNRDSVLF